jgi:DNA-binding transcriptional ArsR family regulator
MDEEPWQVQRLRELEAAAPKRRKKAEPFVKVPLWWIAQATKATNTGRALVCIELLYAAWKTKRATFPLPNGRLTKLGVSPDTKSRALYDLERAGLITVERPKRKTPIITLVVL